MNPSKKIAQFLALIFLALSLFSCDEGCVEADQFDSISIKIESKPSNIYGTYDQITGGQRIDWKDTGLRTNGKPILMHISGTWMSLNGTYAGDDELGQLPLCNLCSKKSGVDNCICNPNQTPEAEKNPAGDRYTLAADGVTPLNCASNASHQDDSSRCTCTKQHGKSTDYGIYSFPLNLLNKDETVKIADQQSNCKYNRGIGAYVALWGRRGVDTPIRAYHLYSEETTCKIKLDSNGKCKDPTGRDFTRYVFRSANSNTFIKDDQDGNDDIDNNTVNDIYHGKNEILKTIMYDQYYSDNYGRYNIEIFGGFGEGNSAGLIEFIVGFVEDILLGKENSSGAREGGIVRYMYQAIVQDSGFAALLQVLLALYIAIFGAAHLWGLDKMNKTEIGKRFLKIGLIMLFISPTSWTFYQTFVVGFFKDGMDSVITLFMTNDEYSVTSDNSLSSNAYRFHYVDFIIRNLMSEAVAKKIISLFFSDPFGLLYIPIIYALIFFFVAIMLYVSTIYIANLIKILFVLAIGPIFFIFSLFKQTFSYFSNWLSYLAGRSFEMIILFIILYMFLTIIDDNFTEMLLYRTCTYKWSVGPLQTSIFKAEINRGIIEWCLFFFTIVSLLFIMMQVIEKIPEIAGALFALKIGGQSSTGGFGGTDPEQFHNRASYGSSIAGSFAFGVANNPVFAVGAALVGASSSAIGNKMASSAAAIGFKGLNAIGNATGFNAAYNKLTGGGIAGSTMNSALNKVLEGSKGNEAKTRADFMSEMESQIKASPAKMAALGINEKSMSAFLDQKLVAEPLQGFLKEAAKEMKNLPANKIPIGEAAINKHLSQKASEWAKKNMSESSQHKVSDLLKTEGIKSLMNEHGTMSGSQAAKALYGNKEAQDKFRADLAHRQFEQNLKGKNALKNPITSGIGRLASNAYNYVTGNPYVNANLEAKNFERALEREGKPLALKDLINPRSIQFIDRALLGNAAADKMAQNAKLNTMRAYLEENPTKKDNKNNKNLTPKEKAALEKENKKNQYFRDELRKDAQEKAGFRPDQSKRKDLLDNFGNKDGRTLFEKAAALSQLNKHAGFNAEDSQTRLAKLLAEEAKDASKKAKEAKTKEEKEAAENRLKKLKKGMFGTEIDENVLQKFLKQEKDNEESKMRDPKNRKTDKEIDQEIDKQHEEIKSIKLDKEKEEIEAIGNKVIENSDNAAKAGDQEEAKKILKEGAQELVKENPSILPKGLDFDDMFGKGFTDALLSGMKDLGLKAGQIIPGQDPNNPDKETGASAAEINSMKMTENQMLGQIKLAKMDLQLKEIELQQLGNSDPGKLASIKKEISELKNSINTLKSSHESLEKTIAQEVKKSN